MLASLFASLWLVLAAVFASAARDCSAHADTISCSSAASDADACCVPRAGRFVFRQRFDRNAGNDGEWGIEGMDVQECDGTPASSGGRKRSHEEIGSACARAPGFNVEENERAWAVSEVGEGVEEVWERVWNTAGRHVSSFCDGDKDVPRFFEALLGLQRRHTTADALEHAGIYPSEDVTYALADIEAALSPFGTPVLRCDDEGKLTCVLWPLHARGNLAGFVPATEPLQTSNCPTEGIIYPAAPVIQPTSTGKWHPIYRPTMRPITRAPDENKRVKYDDDGNVVTKLGFFQKHYARRAGDRDEL